MSRFGTNLAEYMPDMRPREPLGGRDTIPYPWVGRLGNASTAAREASLRNYVLEGRDTRWRARTHQATRVAFVSGEQGSLTISPRLER